MAAILLVLCTSQAMPIDFYCETRKRFLKKATDFKNQWLSIWWAHQDLNLGPKDYEQLKEKLIYINQ